MLRMSRAMALMVALMVATMGAGRAQAVASGVPELGGEQLQRLLAPIALFDDQLLLDTLDASREPVQVLQARTAVVSGGVDQESAARWAPSVLALTRTPRVLDMLADHPAWAERLGQAFAAQGPAVMQAVQALRRRAVESGALVGTAQRPLEVQDGFITIRAIAATEVPLYDPWCVYGAWPAAPLQAFDYSPPPPSCSLAQQHDIVLAGSAPLPAPWIWGFIDWRAHCVWVEAGAWGRLQQRHGLLPWWRRGPPRTDAARPVVPAPTPALPLVVSPLLPSPPRQLPAPQSLPRLGPHALPPAPGAVQPPLSPQGAGHAPAYPSRPRRPAAGEGSGFGYPPAYPWWSPPAAAPGTAPAGPAAPRAPQTPRAPQAPAAPLAPRSPQSGDAAQPRHRGPELRMPAPPTVPAP